MFHDRRDAGRALAKALAQYADRDDVVILALPRGGVPVGYEVAYALRAPLDVFVVRKLGVPGNEELAMGAIAIGGVQVLNERMVRALGVTPRDIARVTAREGRELRRRDAAYRDGREPVNVRDKIAILVDDGLATGATMRAAAEALRARAPRKIVAGAPVASPEACRDLAGFVDEIVCACTPESFLAIGLWYEDFSPTSDEEVQHLLAAACGRSPVC